MAGLIHVILREGLVDHDFIRQYVDGVDQLRAKVAPFTPELVAHRADISIDDLVEAARTLGTARRGGAGGGTGISMTSCTSVVSYLLLCLMSVRGWWAREGDRIERPNVLMPPNHAKAQARGDAAAVRKAEEAIEARRSWLVEAERTLAEFSG